MKALYLDTDGSIKRQALDKSFVINRVDVSDLRTHLQFYADSTGVREFSRRISASATEAGNLVLLGSGDFHHLTLLLLQRISRPFVLAIFDNHTDCSFVYPKYHCGNWMYHAARLPNCEKVVHVGSTEGPGALSFIIGVSALVRQGRISIMPAGECGRTDALERFKGRIGLAGKKSLPVYVSIDKDVLPAEESPGDWDNGIMRTTLLMGLVEAIADNFELAGADITGEAGGKFHYPGDPVKNILSFMEHPRGYGSLSEADSKHRAINMKLLDILGAERIG